jgi:hypothetical protein
MRLHQTRETFSKVTNKQTNITRLIYYAIEWKTSKI